MAFDSKGLRRMTHGGVVGAGSANIKSVWHYATNDAAAVVEAANYFNSAADSLVIGDIILASIDIDGTPTARKYVVASNTGTVVGISAAGEVQGGQTTIADISLAVVTGVDGTGNNAASKADVDTRLGTIESKINAMLAALEASGHNLTA